MMNYRRRIRFHAGTASLAIAGAFAFAPVSAWAQATPADPAPTDQASDQAAPAAPPESADQSDIIITGRVAGSGINKLEAGYSVTTLSADQIKIQAPKSTGDLLKSIPGVWVESSGGISTSNV